MVGESGHRWVDWDEYHALIERLAIVVHESGYAFDHALCLARGGLRVGDVFSRLFRVPLSVLSTSSYREAAGTQRGELAIANSITSNAGPLAGRVLLIDDLVDSGVTLAQVPNYLKQIFPDITEIRSAVIWYKACSVTRPDYFVEYLPENPWIHQPFEMYDEITLDRLATK
ncbi:MAG: phosphoribosyltransferase [Burkholderiaceae bacterium]